jgi:glycosyltransferase involved in cell wall biosynthesis
MTHPRISVVIPSYNQGAFLEETLRSVLSQGYPNLEVLVLDGGSTDNSVDILERYAPYLQYRRSQKDGGQAAAIAEGLRMATGEICAYLNSDDVLAADSLHVVGHAFATNPDVGWLIGDSCMIDSHSHAYHYLREPYVEPKWLVFIRNCIPQPSVFWRASLYDRTTGINPDLHFCMDADLFFQFLEQQEPLMLRKLLSYQRTHPGTKTSRLRHMAMREYTPLLEKYFQRRGAPTRVGTLLWRSHRIAVKLLRQSYVHGLTIGLPRARRDLAALATARIGDADTKARLNPTSAASAR